MSYSGVFTMEGKCLEKDCFGTYTHRSPIPDINEPDDGLFFKAPQKLYEIVKPTADTLYK